MAAIKTLRDFLKRLEKRDDLVRIKRKVSPIFEQAAVLKRIAEASGSTVLFERVGYKTFQMVANVYGGRGKFATLFDVPENEVRPFFEKRSRRKPIPPRFVKRGPAQEVVHAGKPDVGKLLPVPWQYEKDRARFITAGAVVTRDSESGVFNVSVHRLMVQRGNVLSILIIPSMDLGSIFRRAQARKKALEVAVVIGGNPWFFLAATTHIPSGADEFAFAGGLMGEPLKLAPCQTVDLAVPADAEIVIEGRILPEALRPEGPMGEVHGYYGANYPKPIIEISAITHRRAPIFHTLLSGSLEEHGAVCLGVETTILRAMRRVHRGVKDITLLPHFFRCVASVGSLPDYKTAEKLLRVMLGHPSVFLAILVNDDVDIHNADDVFWAISTRTNPEADIVVEQFSPNVRIDDRDIPPLPVKRPNNGRPYKTGINAAIDRKTMGAFRRSRVKELATPK